MAGDGAVDQVALPQGGGAIAGIGEIFNTDLHTGTSMFQVPLPLPPGRNGFGPKLSLSYSSGNPNGVYGFGWALHVPAITRRTDRGMPRYSDTHDTFVLSGAEPLVPIAEPGARAETRYRPQTESAWARISHFVEGNCR